MNIRFSSLLPLTTLLFCISLFNSVLGNSAKASDISSHLEVSPEFYDQTLPWDGYESLWGRRRDSDKGEIFCQLAPREPNLVSSSRYPAFAWSGNIEFISIEAVILDSSEDKFETLVLGAFELQNKNFWISDVPLPNGHYLFSVQPSSTEELSNEKSEILFTIRSDSETDLRFNQPSYEFTVEELNALIFASNPEEEWDVFTVILRYISQNKSESDLQNGLESIREDVCLPE